MHNIGRVQLTLFLATAVVLAFEVSLTRICSVLLQYHISFAVVSFAVLGLGLGGFAARWAVRGHPQRLQPLAAAALLLVAPAMLLALLVLLRTPFATAWPSLLVLILPVFVLTGAFQSLVFAHHAQNMGRLYAADLAGGALGALLAVVAVDVLGGPIHSILLFALVASGTALLLHPPRLLGIALVVVAFAAILLQGTGGFLEVDYDRAPNKLIHRMLQAQGILRPQLLPELQRWDAYSRVDVLQVVTTAGPQRQVFIDGETPTSMLPMDALTPGRSALSIDQALPALPYRLAPRPRVLSIGSGGGYDVRVALRMGSKSIDAVEINAGVLEVVAKARDFHGDVYGQPGVQVHHAEGRQFVRASSQRYDLVIALLAQSLAGNLKEYALSENYLYTRQAFEDYLRVLQPEGCLALVLNNATFVRKLTRTAIEVLDARGVPGSDCVAVIQSPDESPYDQLLLVRSTPFPAEQRRALAQEIATHGYVPRHLPGGTLDHEVRWTPASLASTASVRLQPATDDRPFFFHVEGGMPAGLLLLLRVSGVLLILALTLYALSTQRAGGAAFTAVQQGIYFSLLGVAFMVVEVLALQKTVLLVGFPTLNLAVVLSVFLLAAGLGSAVSARWVEGHGRRALIVVLLVLSASLTALTPLLDLLLAPLDAMSTAARCITVAAVLFPFAFLMGMPFPMAVRLLEERQIDSIPVFWGLNGVASVLGSTAAISLALLLGFHLAMLLGVAMYLLTLIVSLAFRRTVR